MRGDIRINEKALLTLEETSEYSSIGIHRIRALTDDPRCPFVFYNGKKKLVKRKAFDEWVEKTYEI